MTDVRDPAPAAAADNPTRDHSTGGFIWYELMTPDPVAAKRFYDSVVGWTIATESTGPVDGPDYRMIGRSDGGNAGGVLTLTDEMQAHGARPIWVGYLHVADVDATVAAIMADGGSTMLAPFDAPGVGRLAMVTDPQGAVIYLMKPTPPANDPNAISDVFSVDRAQHVRWNELATSDQDAGIDFYARHFGWKQDGGMPMGELGDYKFISRNGVMIGAIMRRPPQLPVSLWTYYVGVDDIDRAASAITEGGGRILNGPMEIPGGEYSLNAIDPQGAAFGLVGPRK